jgi:hypothetical protein
MVKKSRSMHGTGIKCQMFVRKSEVKHRQRCKDNNKKDLKKLGEGMKQNPWADNRGHWYTFLKMVMDLQWVRNY